ncbi:hypothetical protein X927_00730 [Petrotoga mexicana DSM 14811]|uniref:Uncharacterized protein n=1 Tax=Petrotoga mexicana DSM 14811 TaxID=1122954 RepID=A0A2K1PF23_9BACT|nr:hypothetical protein X927_00730 [Petrotoga mexicana DSM 14811]
MKEALIKIKRSIEKRTSFKNKISILKRVQGEALPILGLRGSRLFP